MPGPALTELYSGVDALYCSGKAALPGAVLELLASYRAEAEEQECDVAFLLDGEEFQLAPHGFGRYRYCLRHPNGQVGITPGTMLPALRIQPRAEFLHGVGPREAIAWFAETLGAVVGPIRVSVSRIDLCADFQGWELDGDERHRFVGRARELDTYENESRLTGFTFGRRTSGTITARIYDKTRDAKNKGADYWPGIWGDAFDRERPVHRVEFEFGREVIRQFGLDGPDDVLDATGALWSYATDEWLSYRSPTADETRSRWPVAREWEAVRHARIAEDRAGIERVYAGKVAGSLRKLMPALNGYVVAFAALTGNESPDAACSALARHLKGYERERGEAFASRVAARRRQDAIR